MFRTVALVIAFLSVFVSSFYFVFGMFHIAKDVPSPAFVIASMLAYGAAKTIQRFLPARAEPVSDTKGELP